MLSERKADQDVSEAVFGYLEGRFPNLVPLSATTPLLEGAIDSLGFLELIMFLSERFGISIEDENFDFMELATPAGITAFVERMTR